MAPGADTLSASSWAQALGFALAGRGLGLAFQPIVELRHGRVAGYETLARFTAPGLHQLPAPNRWFAAARRLGLADELEALVVGRALDTRRWLPANCFLTVNVAPDSVASPPVLDVLRGARDLHGVVIELTEQTPIESYAALGPVLDQLRSAGAAIAVDDAGAGYAGLRHLLQLRPSFLKLDRELVVDVDRDEAKRALVEMVGAFADRVDAWVLAEGVERPGELDTLIALGVPLAQGFFLARPAEPWAAVDDRALGQILRAATSAPSCPTVRPLVEQVPWVQGRNALDLPALRAADDLDVVVVLDEHDRPVGFVGADDLTGTLEPVLCVNVEAPVAAAAHRCLTRPRRQRFHPLACCDGAGRYLGLVRVERILHALANASS